MNLTVLRLPRLADGVRLVLTLIWLTAGPQLMAAEPVRLTATVLMASHQGSDYDLDNDAFRDRLIQLFSYSHYRQLDARVLTLPKAERVRLALPEGYELILTLQGIEKTRILTQAVIRKGHKAYVDTILAILSPGVAFLGGPPVEGGTLIIVLETGY